MTTDSRNLTKIRVGEETGNVEGIRRVGGVAILNNTLFSVIFHAFFLPVGGVAVEFKGYRKHFSTK